LTDETVIDVRDLRKYYGTTKAVDGVSFGVTSGEVFGMLGPNGAGKTTAIECIEGLRDADAGSITVFGLRQGPDREKIKARIGLQLQSTGLYPKLTVRELLQLFTTFYPKPASVDALIDMVGLGDKQGTRSKALSGGQKQRLSLALALAGTPDVVFLDEPTTGLDPQGRRSVWDVILDLKRQGKTVMLTTHYMEEAEQLCDRVAVVDQGRIMELDTPAALINRYFKETAIEFPTTPAWPLDKLKDLPGVKSMLAEDDHVVIYSDDVPRSIAGLLEVSTETGATLRDMMVRQATLEDVFLKLTGRRIRE
jgi:ABC-2 type transport system ATP-binding protein